MSEVNFIISIKNLASKEIQTIKKDYDSLNKKVADTADSTTKNEQRSARESEKAQKQRQKAIKETEQRLQALRDATKFLYSGSITGGLLGSAGLLAGFSFTKLTAESDNIRISFLNTFGDKAGSILDSVRHSTKGIVDDTTLMKDAIKTNMAGIRDVNQLPEIFKLGAVASQRLGIDASEGIDLARKAVVEFNEGAMEQLGIINKLDPAYKTQMAIIEKSTKGLGQYLSVQTKLSYVLDQARKRFGDNFDVLETNLQAIQLLGSSLVNLKNNLGYLVGDALAPFARGIGMATNGIIQFIQQVRNDKVFKDGAMSIIRFTVALASMGAILTAAKLAFMGVAAVFSGPFGLIGGLLALTAAVKGARMGHELLIQNLQKMGQMATGVFQLVTSFFSLKDGTAQINKELADMIGERGMYGVIRAAQFVVKAVNAISDVADGLGEIFGPLVGLVVDVMSAFEDTTGLEATNGLFKEIGKGIGSLITLVRYLLIPFDLVENIVGRMANNLRAVVKLIFSLPSMISAVASGDMKSLGKSITDASFVAPVPYTARQLGAAAGPLRDIIAGQGSSGPASSEGNMRSAENSQRAPSTAVPFTMANEATGTTQGSLEATATPREQPASPTIVVQAPVDTTATRVMSQAVRHLQSIDDKMRGTNVFEDKLLMGTGK